MAKLMVSKGFLRLYGNIGMLELIGLVFRKRFVNKVLDRWKNWLYKCVMGMLEDDN